MAKDIKRKIEETEPEEEILFTSLRVSDWTGFLGQKQVKESLKKPTEIRKSNQDSSVHLYYKNLGNIYVCTVCDHVDNKNGYIITAYLTKRIREGEKVHVEN